MASSTTARDDAQHVEQADDLALFGISKAHEHEKGRPTENS